MKIAYLLILTLSNGQEIEKGRFIFYEQCVEQQKVCNANYIGDPCICTIPKEPRR